jgi:hypothetical protein
MKFGKLRTKKFYNTGPRRIANIFAQFFRKANQDCQQTKQSQRIYIKVQFENQQDMHKTTFETLKCLQQLTMF